MLSRGTSANPGWDTLVWLRLNYVQHRYVKRHACHVTRYIFTMVFYTRVPKRMLVCETWFLGKDAYDRGADESI